MRQHASRVPATRRGARAGAAHTGASLPGHVGVSSADAATAHQAGGSWLAGLSRRLATAVILIPIAIALIWFGGWIAFGGAVLTLVIGIWELRTMFAQKGWYPIVVISGAISLAFLVAARLASPARVAIFALAISALLIASFAWVMVSRPTIERTLIDLALTLAIPLYIGWPMALFLLLRGGVMGFGSRNFWWVLALFVMVWANDTAAFVAGHFFGKHKLAPHISPAKTWEGFAGGLVLTVVAAYLLTLPLHISWYAALALGILVTLAATIGDLAESLLKRGVGVKDSGTIVPGHGGILDRIDSLLFAVVVVFFYADFLQGIIR
ncbi:MAG: phosphatidate cytidylyltransferase [Ktedonobacterales bacterium]|nr:phosphatidate cytidylyltransferase [Ktedonobacterales bacterium]